MTIDFAIGRCSPGDDADANRECKCAKTASGKSSSYGLSRCLAQNAIEPCATRTCLGIPGNGGYACVGRLTMSQLLATFDLLTLADAAELLHCSKAHICKAVSGRVPGCPPIPAVSLGRRKLIRRESLRVWIENNERASADANISTLPERDAGKRA